MLAGAFAAFFLLNLVAVAVGALVYHFVPLGAAMGGGWTDDGLRHPLHLGEGRRRGEGGEGGGSFLKVFVLVLLMELGDKTQLTLVALTARYGGRHPSSSAAPWPSGPPRRWRYCWEASSPAGSPWR